MFYVLFTDYSKWNKLFLSKYFLIFIFVFKFLFLLHLINSNKKALFENDIFNLIKNGKTVKVASKCNPFKINTQYYTTINNILYPRRVPIYSNTSINFDCLNQSKNIKKIFLWNAYFKDKTFGYGKLGRIKPFIENNCPISKCELLNDRKRLNESDLVLVHMRDDTIDEPPKYRPHHQRWVFVLFESPLGLSFIRKWNNFFNLTSSYMLDSDFPTYYESKNKFIWKKNESFDENYNYLEHKTKFAAAVITNCGATNKRLLFIEKLKEYIRIDVYGRCGMRCSKVFGRTNCKEKISSIYKFYFAFENTLCHDYITEKFFSILKYPIIPVVLGGGNYDYFIPKSGYINALDFNTPGDLANYLIYISKNVTAYNSYFKWKKHVSFYQKRVIFSPLCEMCINLHLESYYGIKTKIIYNMDELWNKKTNCYYKLFYFFKNILKLNDLNKF